MSTNLDLTECEYHDRLITSFWTCTVCTTVRVVVGGPLWGCIVCNTGKSFFLNYFTPKYKYFIFKWFCIGNKYTFKGNLFLNK